jgi:hypothetical protein
MSESPVQILEVRGAHGEQAVTVTAAITTAASQAIFVALSEQLDRRRRETTATADELLALREQSALAERFESLALAGGHAIVSLSESELRACLLDLTDYADRVDGDHFQPADLRERLETIAALTPVLWDANAAAAAAARASLEKVAP